MGRILGIKATKEDKIIIELESDYNEFLQLNGHIKNICFFSQNCVDMVSRLSGRGKNNVTKYFLIPSSLRRGMDLRQNIKCKRLEMNNKVIFVYMVDKLNI